MDAWMDEWMKVSLKVGSYVSTQRGRVIWGQILITHTGLRSAGAAFKCQIRSFFTHPSKESFYFTIWCYRLAMLTSGLFA